MFNRKILKNLTEWKDKKNRKPLIIRGARQVGKTTVIDIFSKEFKNYVYLNLEKPEDAHIFTKNLNVNELLQSIFLHKNIEPIPNNTLIFLDEIQTSPQAASMLRYFYEEAKEYHFIAAGSLLEIMMENNKISFPVGRVEYLFMYPLSFEEYLIAMEETQALKYFDKIPCPELAHSKLLKLFHQYTLIGGMPEIINQHKDDPDIIKLNQTYQNLLLSYNDDVRKYSKRQTTIPIIQHVIESIPFEAGKRIKFQGFGNSKYRSREISESLKTLERAMLVNLIYPSTMTEPPAQPNLKKSPKLQFLDTGLLNYFAGLQSQYYEYDNLHDFYRGILAEHIVIQQYISTNNKKNIRPLFWIREKKQSSAEIDLLLHFKDLLIPVEIKSGKTGTLRSLLLYMDMCPHDFAIRLYAGGLNIIDTKTPSGKNFKLLNLPYFLAGKINEYAEWLYHYK